MINEHQLDLFKQGVTTTRNKREEEHPGAAEPGQSGV
jgi:hypothetical protein